jgi:hypothetical protein
LQRAEIGETAQAHPVSKKFASAASREAFANSNATSFIEAASMMIKAALGLRRQPTTLFNNCQMMYRYSVI